MFDSASPSICRYFNTPSGCFRKETCTFLHQNPFLPQPLASVPSPSLSKPKPYTGRIEDVEVAVLHGLNAPIIWGKLASIYAASHSFEELQSFQKKKKWALCFDDDEVVTGFSFSDVYQPSQRPRLVGKMPYPTPIESLYYLSISGPNLENVLQFVERSFGLVFFESEWNPWEHSWTGLDRISLLTHRVSGFLEYWVEHYPRRKTFLLDSRPVSELKSSTQQKFEPDDVSKRATIEALSRLAVDFPETETTTQEKVEEEEISLLEEMFSSSDDDETSIATGYASPPLFFPGYSLSISPNHQHQRRQLHQLGRPASVISSPSLNQPNSTTRSIASALSPASSFSASHPPSVPSHSSSSLSASFSTSLNSTHDTLSNLIVHIPASSHDVSLSSTINVPKECENNKAHPTKQLLSSPREVVPAFELLILRNHFIAKGPEACLTGLSDFKSKASPNSKQYAGCSHSAALSELLSIRLMKDLYGLRLLATEMDVKYTVAGPKIDYTCTIPSSGTVVGVSVTRAFTLKGDGRFSKSEVGILMQKKLQDMKDANHNAVEKWKISILHVWAPSLRIARHVLADFPKRASITGTPTGLVLTTTTFDCPLRYAYIYNHFA